MYKVRTVQGGWHVFFVEDDKPPRLIDGHVKPYTHRSNAYRKCKKLNDAVKDIEKMIARDGAIIV